MSRVPLARPSAPNDSALPAPDLGARRRPLPRRARRGDRGVCDCDDGGLWPSPVARRHHAQRRGTRHPDRPRPSRPQRAMTRRWGETTARCRLGRGSRSPSRPSRSSSSSGSGLSSASTAVRPAACGDRGRPSGRSRRPQALAAVAVRARIGFRRARGCLVCVSASTPSPAVALPAVRARACALDGGR